MPRSATLPPPLQPSPTPPTIQVLVGLNMRRIRVTLQLTQEQLAERASLHPVYISCCERGEHNVSITVLAQIAAALHVPPHVLLESHPQLANPPLGLKVYAKRLRKP
jgi:transcriptional regulator with XRE-family HTH domain